MFQNSTYKCQTPIPKWPCLFTTLRTILISMVLRSIEAESLESPTAAGAIAEKMFDLAFIKSGKTLFRASKMFLNL